MKPDIEEMLRAFLEEQRSADISGSLRRIWDQLNHHEKEDERRHAEIHGDVRGLSIRVGRLEHADEKIEEKLEKSGSWDREALIAEAKEHKENANWFSREGWKWVLGVVGAVVVGVLEAAILKH